MNAETNAEMRIPKVFGAKEVGTGWATDLAPKLNLPGRKWL